MELHELLVSELLNRPKWPKKPGRYNASKIYDISHGKMTPEEYFNQPPFHPQTLLIFEQGNIYDARFKTLLNVTKGFEAGKKVEVKVEDFIISGELDSYDRIKNEPYELKSIGKFVEEIKKAKSEHLYQVETYLRGCDSQRGWISYITKQPSQPLWTKTFLVERDDKRWARIVEGTRLFHQQCLEYLKTK